MSHIIELWINDQCIKSVTCNGKNDRRKIIYAWDKQYPIKATQKRFMVIKKR